MPNDTRQLLHDAEAILVKTRTRLRYAAAMTAIAAATSAAGITLAILNGLSPTQYAMLCATTALTAIAAYHLTQAWLKYRRNTGHLRYYQSVQREIDRRRTSEGQGEERAHERREP